MNYPRIEIDDLTAIIRESMAAQRIDDQQLHAAAPAVSSEQRPPELKLQPDFQPHSDHRYHVNDLLRFHDRTFVQAAYRAVLKRSPDETEFLRELKRLRGGNVNKIDLLATLRFSTEGRAKGVQLDGLMLPALIRRLGQLPLIGYIVRLAIAFVRLPNLVRDQRQFAGHVLAQQEQIAEFVNDVSARLAASRHEVSRLTESLSKQLLAQEAVAAQQAEFERATASQFNQIGEEFSRRVDQQQQQLAASESKANERFAELQSRIESLLGQLEKERTDRQTAVNQFISEQRQLLATTQSEFQSELTRLALQLQHSRSELAIQGEAIRTFSSGGERSAAQAPVKAEAHQLDALYAALEDRFRGTREEIKERFDVYLPYVQNAAPVVDLGCGRGEWLEILGAAGLEAHGVDTNRIQVEQCRALGLSVSEEDFVAHLRSLGDASIGAVTGFHIIEHVPLDTLLTLMNEVMRVLRPGGLVIFETPNSENVIVGSHYFYFDPTHRHPLPSELMEFLLDSRGFHDIEILKLHPWDSAKLAEDNELAASVNTYFYGPMDYAILGRKVSQ